MLKGRVYPRVGGATRVFLALAVRPTARRSIPAWAGQPAYRSAHLPHASAGGSIPAWAGQPFQRPVRPRPCDSVYPRVGGATLWWGTRSNRGLSTQRSKGYHRTLGGLSPRGRGNRRWGWTLSKLRSNVGGEAVKEGLSPRGRGNRLGAFCRWLPILISGLSPRGRGNLLPSSACRAKRIWAGLSPRGRGNPEHMEEPGRANSRRSIPAWAGQPGSAASRRQRGARGLSPRGRGNRHSHWLVGI